MTSFSFASPTELILIRHGQTDWNLERRFQGHADIPLNATGESQATVLATYVSIHHKDASAIYASDLIRAYKTAEKTAQVLELPIATSTALREMDWGSVDGMKVSEVDLLYKHKEKALKVQYPDRKERWDYMVYPEAETYNQLLHRFTDQLTAIATSHPEQKVMVFTHSRAIRVFLINALGTSKLPPIGNCDMVHLTFDPEEETPTLRFVKITPLPTP